MPFTKVGSVTLHYETAGDRLNPAIVLLAGLGMPAAFWPRELVAGLVRGGFSVILFDNRDSGESTSMQGQISHQDIGLAIGRALLRLNCEAPYSLEDMAWDTEGLIASLGLDKVHLVGVSMGGMIAQALACAFPGHVQSLTCVMSATGNPRTGLGKAKALQALLLRPEQQSTEDYLVHVMDSLAGSGFRSSRSVVRSVASKMAAVYNSEGAARQLMAILASGDRSRSLESISAPTLVIHGDEDPLLPLAAGREIAAGIANARMQVIPGLGHELPPGACSIIADAVCAHCHASLG